MGIPCKVCDSNTNKNANNSNSLKNDSSDIVESELTADHQFLMTSTPKLDRGRARQRSGGEDSALGSSSGSSERSSVKISGSLKRLKQSIMDWRSLSINYVRLPKNRRSSLTRRKNAENVEENVLEEDENKLEVSENCSCPVTVARLTGYQLYAQQFYAILIKRFQYIRRNWKALFSQILLPALFVAVAMSVALTVVLLPRLPPLELSPAQYYNYTRPEGNVIPYCNNEKQIPVNLSGYLSGEQLVKTLYNPAGIAATCLLKFPNNTLLDTSELNLTDSKERDFTVLEKYFIPSCSRVFYQGLRLTNFVPPKQQLEPDHNHSWWWDVVTLVPDRRAYPICHCNSQGTGFICNYNNYSKLKPIRLITADLLYDITGQKESDYYVYTTDMYRLRRYGALSFGHALSQVPEDYGRGAPEAFRKIAVRHVSKVWYNNKGYHSMPIYLNAMNNAILRASLPKEMGNPGAYGFTLINHPMEGTNAQLSKEKILEGTDVLIAMFIVTAMSFVPASFVLFLVSERDHP